MEVKGIFSSIKSSINGMSSQMARIGAISQNIANAEKLPDEDGNVYKRKVVKQSGFNSSGNNFDQQLSIKMKKTKSSHFGGGNELSASSSSAGKGFEIIELDEVDKIYDPNNPLAGDDGYVVRVGEARHHAMGAQVAALLLDYFFHPRHDASVDCLLDIIRLRTVDADYDTGIFRPLIVAAIDTD